MVATPACMMRNNSALLRASVLFLAIAPLTYAFGAYGIAGFSFETGKTLMNVFLMLAGIAFVASIVIESPR